MNAHDHPEAAHAATDVGADDDMNPAEGIVVSALISLALVACAACVALLTGWPW